MVQDFDRRSNPNCPFNHAQANLTTHEQRHRLHEKFFAPGVNNRRFPSPKTISCEKVKKYFLFAFCHSLFFLCTFFFFSRFTVELKTDLATRQENLPMYRNLHWSHRWRGWSHRCRTQNRFGHAPGKSPDVQKLALVPPLARLVPPLAQVGFTDLLLFVTLPIFCLERSFLHQNKA